MAGKHGRTTIVGSGGAQGEQGRIGHRFRELECRCIHAFVQHAGRCLVKQALFVQPAVTILSWQNEDRV